MLSTRSGLLRDPPELGAALHRGGVSRSAEIPASPRSVLGNNGHEASSRADAFCQISAALLSGRYHYLGTIRRKVLLSCALGSRVGFRGAFGLWPLLPQVRRRKSSDRKNPLTGVETRLRAAPGIREKELESRPSWSGLLFGEPVHLLPD
jgi:hypothetical protein